MRGRAQKACQSRAIFYSSAATSGSDRPADCPAPMHFIPTAVRGPLFMLVATGSYVINDTMMKMATVGLPPYEVLFLRGLAALLWGIPMLLLLGYRPADASDVRAAGADQEPARAWRHPLLCGGARQHADRRCGGARPDHAAAGAARRLDPLPREDRRRAHGADRARLRRRADGGAADHAGHFDLCAARRSPTRCSARRATSPDGGSRATSQA